MTALGGRDGRTRRRVLETATRQFAERGFRRVTVRAICRDARANVASVNYHFGDKLGLYREVLEAAAAVVMHVTEEAIRAGAGLSADERLRAYVRTHSQYLKRVAPANWLQQLIHRELQEPTAVLSAVIDRVWRPRFEYLGSIVGELLGLPADDDRVVRCAISVHAQIMVFKPSPAHARMGRRIARAFKAEHAADHIIAFSLAGMGAYQTGTDRTGIRS